jgi:hypothetical protein
MMLGPVYFFAQMTPRYKPAIRAIIKRIVVYGANISGHVAPIESPKKSVAHLRMPSCHQVNLADLNMFIPKVYATCWQSGMMLELI